MAIKNIFVTLCLSIIVASLVFEHVEVVQGRRLLQKFSPEDVQANLVPDYRDVETIWDEDWYKPPTQPRELETTTTANDGDTTTSVIATSPSGDSVGRVGGDTTTTTTEGARDDTLPITVGDAGGDTDSTATGGVVDGTATSPVRDDTSTTPTIRGVETGPGDVRDDTTSTPAGGIGGAAPTAERDTPTIEGDTSTATTGGSTATATATAGDGTADGSTATASAGGSTAIATTGGSTATATGGDGTTPGPATYPSYSTAPTTLTTFNRQLFSTTTSSASIESGASSEASLTNIMFTPEVYAPFAIVNGTPVERPLSKHNWYNYCCRSWVCSIY